MVAIGEKEFIITISVVSSLVVLAFVIAAYVTKGWKGITERDYTNLKNVIISSSTGGTGIRNEVIEEHLASGTVWVGDASDRAIGHLRMILRIEKGLGLVTKSESRVHQAEKRIAEEAQPLTPQSGS